MYCRSLHRDNVSKRKAVIRESVSPYPSKISERLAYFIFEHGHGISGPLSGKIPQVKSNPGCHFFGLSRSFGKFEFTFHYVCTGLCFMRNKTPFRFLPKNMKFLNVYCKVCWLN